MGDNMQLVTASAICRLAVTVTKNMGDNADLADPTAQLNLELADTLANGRGNDQANLLYSDSKSIAASASQAYDLVGSLSSYFGDTLEYDNVKGMMIKNTGTVDIRFVATSFTTWCKDAADYIIVKPDGVFYLYSPDAGYDVSAGSDTITITNTSASTAATYELGILGVEIDSSSSSSSTDSSSSSSSSTESSSSSTNSSSSSSSTDSSSSSSTDSSSSSSSSTLSSSSSSTESSSSGTP